MQAIYRRHHTLPVRAFNRLRISARSAFPSPPEASAGTPCGAIHETGKPPCTVVEYCEYLRVGFLHCRWSRRQRACSQSSSSSTTSTTSCAHTRRASAECGRFSDSTHGLLARYSITPHRCWRVRLGGCAADVRAISAQPHSAWLSEDDLRWILKEGIDLDRTAVSPPAPHTVPRSRPPSHVTMLLARHGVQSAFRRFRCYLVVKLAPERGGGQSAMSESVHAVRWS